MKWNKKPEPKDNEPRVESKFAWFPTAVCVIGDDRNPLDVKYGYVPSTTKYVWLCGYQSLYRFQRTGSPKCSYWWHLMDFVVE